METIVGDPLARRTFSGYSRHYWSAKLPRDRYNDVVWVNKRYTPNDLRSLAPTQRHKFLTQPVLTSLPLHWVPLSEAPLRSFSRASEERHIYKSDPSSRDERWSTLRQMLPSRGHCECTHTKPLKWGIGSSQSLSWSLKKPRRYPHITSPMTSYIDEMHLTNKLFKLH